MSDTPTACPPLSVHLTSSDILRSIAFYRDALGFTLKGTWPTEGVPMWASLELNGSAVMLGACMDAGDDGGGELDATHAVYRQTSEDFKKAAGGGVLLYLEVPDVDAYHAEVSARGAAPLGPPKDQFYGIREFPLRDPDGYVLVFNQPIQLATCQSCGMPLADAEPGRMYCDHCTDDAGDLRPWAEVLEGTTVGYFMGMQKMERAEAEAAARAHLAKLPAWVGMGE